WSDKTQVFDGYADGFFFQGGHTKPGGSSFQLSDYESVGRFRVIPGNEISPRLGYDLTYLDNHTHAPGIPDQLTDESIAIGTGIAKWDKWVAGITLGVGYAGSSAFDVGSAWYGKADFIVAREINADDAIGLIIDYDGHRTYLPDTPLPGLGYSHRFDPKLQIVAGAPYSSIVWKPIDHLEFNAEYHLLQDFKFSAAYEFITGWKAYARYDFIRDAFHTDGLAKDHRLLFYEQRAESGVQYDPDPHLTFKIGLGYSWDGSYRDGFDFRSNATIADFADRPYLRGGLEIRY
ncbi:MAG TPA: hypothetical protein VG326_16565, partial [Tepidisphaeraceae bacterium]|nr:hypothetical protein [Tepidisphaeraceae bacterium]